MAAGSTKGNRCDRSAAQRRADLEDQEQRRREREILLAQSLRERETRRQTEWRRDNLVMAITAGSFLAAVGLAVIAALSGQVGAYGSSGVSFLLFAAGLRRLVLTAQDRIA